MVAFLLAALAGVCFGAMTVAVRTGFGRSAEPVLSPLVCALVACALLAVAAGASGQLAEARFDDVWRFMAIGAGVPGLSQILFVLAIRDAGPSRAAVLIGTAPVISAALAIAFLGEPFEAPLGIATVLIVLGGALLALEGRRPAEFRALGAVLALACAAAFGVRDNLVRLVARSADVPPLAAATASLAGATIALALFIGLAHRGEHLPRRAARTVLPFLPAGLFLGAAYAALLEAFDHGDVTVVAPLNATQSLWAVVFSALLLRRSEMIGRRLVAAGVLIVAGSALIGATR